KTRSIRAEESNLFKQMRADFGVRNCRLCQLKLLHDLALLIAFFLRRDPSLRFETTEASG
ncbi:MAG TPA: hypothetical protein VJ370_05660, partial [Streptosporangiaceae bacterium]|nr:hypothetical protein [Streptosporangiaceae bacterium]